MIEIQWTELILAVTTIISGVVTHLINKKKYGQEIKKLEADNRSLSIQNMEKSLDYYEKWVDAANKRLEEVLVKQDNALSENYNLKELVSDMRLKLDHMNALLCTDIPCTRRVRDSAVIDCIYLQDLEKQKDV